MVEHVVNAEGHFIVGQGVIRRPASVRAPLSSVESLRNAPAKVVLVMKRTRSPHYVYVERGYFVYVDAALLSASALVVSFLDAGLRVGPVQGVLDHASAHVTNEPGRVLELTFALGQDSHLKLSAASVFLLVRRKTGLRAVTQDLVLALQIVGRMF